MRLFFIGLVLSIVLPSFTSLGRLGFFFPAIVQSLYLLSPNYAYLMAFISGFCMDTIASDYQHLGIYTLNYLITCFILEKKKRSLLQDSAFTYPLTVAIFSMISSLIGVFLVSFIESKSLFGWVTMLIEFFFSAIFDAFYAALILQGPQLISYLLPKRKNKGFSLRRPY